MMITLKLGDILLYNGQNGKDILGFVHKIEPSPTTGTIKAKMYWVDDGNPTWEHLYSDGCFTFICNMKEVDTEHKAFLFKLKNNIDLASVFELKETI